MPALPALQQGDQTVLQVQALGVPRLSRDAPESMLVR